MTDDELFADDIPHPAERADERTLRRTRIVRAVAVRRGAQPRSARCGGPRVTARCSSSPAPARARPACSPTASPTSSTMGVHPVQDPGDHLHQQGRRRDARARRRARRPGREEDVGVDVPLRVRAHPAANGDLLGYPASVLDLRPGRRQPPHRLRHPRPRPRRQAVHAPWRARHHQRWKNDLVDPEEAQRRAQNIFERKHADVYAEYQARLLKAGAMDFDDLLTQHRAAVPRAPRRARALPPALRAHPRRRVPGHQPGPERDGPPARRRPPQRLRRRRHRPVPAAGHVGRRRRTGRRRSSRSRSATSCRAPVDVAIATAGTVAHVHEGRYDGHARRGHRRRSTADGTPHHLVPGAARAATRTNGSSTSCTAPTAASGSGGPIGVRPPAHGKLQHGLRRADATRSTPTQLWILKVCDVDGRGRRTGRRSSPPSTGSRRRASTASDATLAMDEAWLGRLYDDRSTPRRGPSG